MFYRPNSDRVSASLFDDKGTLYAKGVFEGNLRDSTWQFFKGEKLILIENYKRGKRDGKSTGYDRNGKVNSEKEWKNDSPDGRCVDYYPGGTKRSVVAYQEGKRNGPAMFYDESGVVSMDGKYAGDLSDGDWNVYDKEGKLKYVIKYNKGEIINKDTLDSMQLEEFTKYEKARGQIPEPKVNENGMPERQ